MQLPVLSVSFCFSYSTMDGYWYYSTNTEHDILACEWYVVNGTAYYFKPEDSCRMAENETIEFETGLYKFDKDKHYTLVDSSSSVYTYKVKTRASKRSFF
ncbi:MAG: hypothetical protein HUJ53_04265 [Holdemanella sp.]|nr:hypothetical protein [Holdemanella sp.]